MFKILYVTLCICVSMASLSFGEAIHPGIQQRNEAISLYQNGRWAEAMDKIGWAVQNNPQDAMNFYWRAVIRSDEEGRLKDLEHAIHLEPNLVQAYLQRADYYRRHQQYQRALKDVTFAIDRQPLRDAYVVRAHILFELTDWKGVVRDASMALQLGLNQEEIWMLRARALAHLGQVDLAIKDYVYILQMNAQQYDAYFELALLYFNSKQFKEASWAFQSALELSEKDAGLFNNLGLALMYAGDLQGAVQVLRRLIVLFPEDVHGYNHLGQVYFEKGEMTTSTTFFTMALERGLREAGVYYNRARAFFEQLNLKQSSHDVFEAIEINENFVPAYRLLGDILSAQKKYLLANMAYAEFLRRSRGEHRAVLYDMAKNWMHTGRYEKAIASWNFIVLHEPQFKEAYFRRGLSYAAQGFSDLAIKDYQMVLTIDPQNAESYYNWGNELYRLGFIVEAIEKYDRAIEIAPLWKDLYYNRSLAKETMGDHVGSKEDFRLSQLS